ncbi:MAG: tRNA (guanosine(37)-N1)-methyltransferase TrmD [Pseudomonadota bacterium]
MDGPDHSLDAISVPMLTVRVLTLFPEMFPGPLAVSLAGKALERGDWRLETLDIRDFARDKHRTVDDTPFGGGAGMVMKPDVVSDAIIAAKAAAGDGARAIYLSPRGQVFDQAMARSLTEQGDIILLCGRYEGVDQRVSEAHGLEEVSLGDFVLSGGEPAAIAMVDAIVRLLPGVMGNANSGEEESFGETSGLLEYPHYTRPAVWQGPDGVDRAVPEVLTSGHHAEVEAWRRGQAESITERRRPDLWHRSRWAEGIAKAPNNEDQKD